MMQQCEYNHQQIEQKWQRIWEEEKTYRALDLDTSKPKYYALIEFPYPSGEGLHAGHPRPYTAMDIVSRKRRLQNFNVLFAMGWDAFGLPTENYAIKTKIHPRIVTQNNIHHFKAQLKSLGMSFDWDREINTTDPEYYKWTQWIFLKLFEKGLAYKKEIPINWCTSCRVGLANEEVVNGRCERCGGEVVQKTKNQWMLKITDYADKLIDDLALVDFSNRVKTQQRNWIGRSQGMEIDFRTTCSAVLTVYTTRPDTLFGATYLVIAPEHGLLQSEAARIENLAEIIAYQDAAGKRSDFERTELAKNKTGIELKGIRAINPATGKEVPIWVSDYVLMSYGTGAIMAVPAHDERDYEFAKRFQLPILQVVAGDSIDDCAYTAIEGGILINSGFLNGLEVEQANEMISQWLIDRCFGRRKKNFKLRDWVFSRQRYWGEPIPLVWCDHCGWTAIPEEELPLTLPELESYVPSEDGESPLSKVDQWVHTTCPKCKGPGRRETDTMPQWAGSSWYFLRYTDAHNQHQFADRNKLDYWMPVDWYNGGMEHTTLHLLYSRFWHKFLYDCKLVTMPEPYMKRTSHGMILGENNEKMSKSRGNVVNPDEIVAKYGADTLRVYEMFIGDFEKSVAWSNNGIKGCRRFLERVWNLVDLVQGTDGDPYSAELNSLMHQTIKKVSEDYETLKFNTAIAAMMTLVNQIYDLGHLTPGDYKTLLMLLNPVAPHITEELWALCGFPGRLQSHSWPDYEEAQLHSQTVEIVIQLNGKVKGKMLVNRDEPADAIRQKLLDDPHFSHYFTGNTLQKEIYVPGKIYNLVTHP